MLVVKNFVAATQEAKEPKANGFVIIEHTMSKLPLTIEALHAKVPITTAEHKQPRGVFFHKCAQLERYCAYLEAKHPGKIVLRGIMLSSPTYNELADPNLWFRFWDKFFALRFSDKNILMADALPNLSKLFKDRRFAPNFNQNPKPLRQTKEQQAHGIQIHGLATPTPTSLSSPPIPLPHPSTQDYKEEFPLAGSSKAASRSY